MELSQLLNNIKTEIGAVVERNLLPHFERMKCNNENIKLIETVLRQMPEFQRLEKENEELKRELEGKNTQAAAASPPDNTIKLEIIESAIPAEIISENELYKVASLSGVFNKQIDEEVATEEEAEASEAEASEAEASEAEASEAETEAEEEAEPLEEAEEEEETEAEEEEEAEPLEEAEEEEDGVEGAEPLEEAEEEEEDGVEGAEPLEEEASEAEAEEDGVEGAEPLEEEVSITDIKGHGKFYTSNVVNGDIYKIDPDEEVGDQVGKFVNGFPIFF